MTKDMTQGSPLKLILAFAVPLMLGSLFQQFYNLADTIIVGRFVGVEALAAVGSVGGLNYLVLGFVNGIACGFSIPISWTFGAKDYKEMRRYTANTVWLSVAFAVVLTVVTVALTRAVLVWTNTPANIIDIADIYIRTIFWGIPFTLLYNMTSALMRALGDSKRPLYFLLVASFLNIGLDLLCIIVFRMGAFGAAFATVFSQAVAGLGSLLYILKHYGELRWSREEGQLSRTHCAKLCSMGIPMGLQCSITAIGSVVLQGAVNGLGSDIVAAQTAGGKAAQFLSVPLESIGTAMTTYASQNMGAHDLNRVNRGVNTALSIGVVYSIASFLILRVADKPLIGLFLESDQTEIMANAQSFIFWNSVFYIPLAVLIIYRYTIQGLGHSGLAMFAGVAEMIARAMVGFLLGNTVSANGSVSRGVCVTDESRNLVSVTERTCIEPYADGIHYSEDGGKSWADLPADCVVSMNLWGFTPAYVQEAKAGFAAFLQASLPVNPMKCEYYLPTVVTNALEAGKADVHVLTSADKWHGITYREDKPELVEALKKMSEDGLYPVDRLF